MSPKKESSTRQAKILNRPEHTRPDSAQDQKKYGEAEFGCGGPRDA